MKATLRAMFVAALTFAAATVATAAPAERGWAGRESRDDRSSQYDGRHAPARQTQAPRYAPRPVVVRHAANRHAANRPGPDRYYAPRYAPPRAHAWRSWQRGQYLPVQYRARPYVLDYRAYRLAPPPRGYHYVRVDDRAVLVAITNGLIANVVNDLFYR